MSRGETADALIDSLYAAALQGDVWDIWSARATAWIGGFATGFTVWDKADNAARCHIIQHPSQTVLDRYVDEQMWRLDPQLHLLGRTERFAVFCDTDHLDLADAGTREHVRWTADNADIGHHLSITVPLSRDVIFGFSTHRKVAQGATPGAARERLQALAPHLRRALELGFMHSRLLASTQWDGLLNDQTEPALLLDEAGRVLRASAMANELFATGDGLDAPCRRLVAAEPASDAALQGVIARALPAAGAIAGAARIARRSERAPYVVSVFPLVRAARALAPAEAAALVTIVDPARAPVAFSELWQQAFAFTAREIALAEKLVDGHSLESAAATLEITRNTARAHLRNLFAKTGCTRQTDFVRLLIRIG